MEITMAIGLRKEMPLENFKEMWRLDNATH